MDRLSTERRSANMAAIRSKDTKPEMIVRKGLWSRGFRYRLNHKRLPGHPDIVLRKYRTCIFVNGCFWHGHGVIIENNHISPSKTYPCFRKPNSNLSFWENKIIKNRLRDKDEQRKLAAMGWHCITVWECELTPKKREETLESLVFTLNHIWLQDRRCPAEDKIYPQQEEEDMNYLRAAEEEIENE